MVQSYPDYDLIITGRYFYDKRHDTYFFPGPSMFVGLPLILLGLPAGSMDRYLAFEIQALDPKDPSEPLWTARFNIHDDTSGLIGGYYGSEGARPDTPKLWNKAFSQVRESLAKALDSNGRLGEELLHLTQDREGQPQKSARKQ